MSFDLMISFELAWCQITSSSYATMFCMYAAYVAFNWTHSTKHNMLQLLFSSTAVEKKYVKLFSLVVSFSFLRYQLLFEVLVCFRNIFEWKQHVHVWSEIICFCCRLTLTEDVYLKDDFPGYRWFALLLPMLLLRVDDHTGSGRWSLLPMDLQRR